MKSKTVNQSGLKGVALSILATKGKSEKVWIDSLSKSGCKVQQADDVKKCLKLALESPTKVLITDISFCDELNEIWENNPNELSALGTEMIIISTPAKSEDASLWAKRFNGYYISTPMTQEVLITTLERALDTNLLKTQIERYKSLEQSVEQYGSIVVKSPEMKDVLRLARILSTRDDSILMMGGIGTGKELIAQTIHENSPRKHGPFYSLNCRSFANEDLAVELFGRGEPDSEEAQEGKTLIEICEGGTLLLDEIGIISPNVQGKLQRLLEDGTYTRVNSRTICKSDVRVFVASSTPLDEAVAKGEFSEDLYFRLNRFTLHIPSLRRRVEDIPVLSRNILSRMVQDQKQEPLQITGETLKMLMEYHWPGNVRELENVLEFAALVAAKGPIEPKHLPKQFRDEVGSIFVGASVDELPPISEIEKRYILRVMDATRGNKVKAAQILDINRATLHRKLQMYETQKMADLG
jgi:DNA-binding NtrC family response regulator